MGKTSTGTRDKPAEVIDSLILANFLGNVHPKIILSLIIVVTSTYILLFLFIKLFIFKKMY